MISIAGSGKLGQKRCGLSRRVVLVVSNTEIIYESNITLVLHLGGVGKCVSLPWGGLSVPRKQGLYRPPPDRNVRQSSFNSSAPTDVMCLVPIISCTVLKARAYPQAAPTSGLSIPERSIKSGGMHTRRAGPTLVDARQCFVPCGISCCVAARARPPTRLCSNLYNWERQVNPNNTAKLVRLRVNKGVLNKIMLMVSRHNHKSAVGN